MSDIIHLPPERRLKLLNGRKPPFSKKLRKPQGPVYCSLQCKCGSTSFDVVQHYGLICSKCWEQVPFDKVFLPFVFGEESGKPDGAA